MQGEGHSFTERSTACCTGALQNYCLSGRTLCRVLSEEGPLIYLPAPSCLLGFIGAPVLLLDLLAPPSSYWGTQNLGESVGVMEASPGPPPR